MGLTLEDDDNAGIGNVIDSIGCGCAQMMIAIFAGSFFCLEACVLTMFSFLLPILEDQFDVSGFGASLLGVSAFFGMFLGCFFWGWFSDRFGRKDSILICVFICNFFGCLSGVCFSEYTFGICAFFFGFGIGGGVIGFSFYIEFLPRNFRGITLINIEMFWTIGVILECLISWVVLTNFEKYNWNFLVLFSNIPCLVTLFLIPFVPRSPRYLVVQNNAEALEETIQWVEWMNCRKRDPQYNDLTKILENAHPDKYLKKKKKKDNNMEDNSPLEHDGAFLFSINDDESTEDEKKESKKEKNEANSEEKQRIIGINAEKEDYQSTNKEKSPEEEEEESNPPKSSSEEEIIHEVDMIDEDRKKMIKKIDAELEKEAEEEYSATWLAKCKLLCNCETIFLFFSIIVFYTAGSFGYYGVALSTPNFFNNGNEFLGTFVVSLAEFPGLFLSSLSLYTLGRKATQTLTFLLSSLGLVLLIFPHEALWETILFGLLARGSVMGASCTTWVIAQESLPTSLRSLGCGIAAGIAKGATCFAPIVVEVFPENNSFIPKVLFGLSTAIAGILCIFYPFETKGKNLSDFVSDGNEKKKKKNKGGKIIGTDELTNNNGEYERML